MLRLVSPPLLPLRVAGGRLRMEQTHYSAAESAKPTNTQQVSVRPPPGLHQAFQFLHSWERLEGAERGGERARLLSRRS